jgi:MFS family permease
MDRFGRKFTIQLGAFLCIIGASLQAAAQNLPMILAGRILAGWAVGLMSMAVPVYQAECAHPRSRGMIVGLAQQMIGIGFIVSTYDSHSHIIENTKAKLIGIDTDGSAMDPSMHQLQANSSGDFLLPFRLFQH